MGLILVGILLSLFGDASVTLFAIGLAVVGAGTVVLTALFVSALGHIEERDVLPESESWRSFSAPGCGTWVYPDADSDVRVPRAEQDAHDERERPLGARAGRAQVHG
jgi:hypothetical protein